MIFNRLGASDLTNLALEAPDTLMHQAAVGVLDAAPLIDAEGHVLIERVRARLEPKVQRMPELRRVLRTTRFLQGRPLWIDDPDFRIENHVTAASLPAPGGRQEMVRFVARAMAVPMDRSRPLWQLFLLEGYAPDRVGIVLKTHHALADGPAMINIVAQLFDLEPVVAEAPAAPWLAEPPPSSSALMKDNFRRMAAGVVHGAAALRHPVRLGRLGALTLRGGLETVRQGRGASRTSLNRPIGVARRLALCRFRLSEVKLAAHQWDVTVNDVFLGLVAGGLREVLLARHERVDGIRLHASIAVSMHAAGDETTIGNRIGTMIVPLSLDSDPEARLRKIAAGTMAAKSTQRAVVSPAFMAVLARSGLTRHYIRRQHMVSVLTTNLPGPQFPFYLAGARVLEVYPVPPIAGNVTLSVAALSYDGQFAVSMIADHAAWPDLDVLVHGIESAWHDLAGARANVPLAAGL